MRLERNLDLFEGPEYVDEEDPHTLISAREFLKEKLALQRISVNKTLYEGKSETYYDSSSLISRGQSANVFTYSRDKQKRTLDVLVHKHERLQQKRDKLMVELNSIRELQFRYSQMTGNDSFTSLTSMMLKSQQSSASVSPYRFRKSLRSRQMLHQSLDSSSLKLMQSPSFKSQMVEQSHHNKLLTLKHKLLELEEKTQQESLDLMRMKKIKDRERTQQVAEQLRISLIRPQVEQLDNVYDKAEQIKNLDKCRRLMAFNTLKTWQKRIRSKGDKRQYFLQDRKRELNHEESESNQLLLEYYTKINQLRELKDNIRKLQERNEEIKIEQIKEEKLLGEKEVEFFMVDRLGLLLLIQKYYQGKRITFGQMKSDRTLKNEFQQLKSYYSNIERFSLQGQEVRDAEDGRVSPSKVDKTQMEVMEERIAKLKQYQRYYQENWEMIKDFNFQFNYIANKYIEVQFQVHSLQNQHNDLTKVVNNKRRQKVELQTLLESIQRDYESLSNYVSGDQSKMPLNQLMIRQSDLTLDSEQLQYNSHKSTLLYEKVMSTITNILQHTSCVMGNFRLRLKITFPTKIDQILTKYYNSKQPQLPKDNSRESYSSSVTPEKFPMTTSTKKNQMTFRNAQSSKSKDSYFQTFTFYSERSSIVQDMILIIRCLDNEVQLLRGTKVENDKPRLFSINESDMFFKDQAQQKKSTKMMNFVFNQKRNPAEAHNQKKSHVEKYLLEPEKAATLLEDQEEEDYIMQAKQQIRMKKIQKQTIKKATNNPHKTMNDCLKMVQKFERKELEFMEQYMLSYKNSINGLLERSKGGMRELTMSTCMSRSQSKRGGHVSNLFARTIHNERSQEQKHSTTLSSASKSLFRRHEKRSRQDKLQGVQTMNPGRTTMGMVKHSSLLNSHKRKDNLLMEQNYQGYLNNDKSPYQDEMNSQASIQQTQCTSDVRSMSLSSGFRNKKLNLRRMRVNDHIKQSSINLSALMMEGSDQVNRVQSGDDFVFGKSSKADHDKRKKKNADEMAEERLKQTFNVGGGSKDHDELKRKREDFAVQLRKKNREEMFKQKRAFIGEGATNTPAGATAQQKPAGENQAMTLGPQNQLAEDQLIYMSVEDALASSERMTAEAFIAQTQRMAFNIQDFKKLLILINDQNEVRQTFATIGFRRLLSQERNPPIQAVIDANLVPRFISFLQRTDLPKLQVMHVFSNLIQFEAAWCLTNLASGQSDHVQVLIEKGTINVLVDLLNSPHIEVVEQAIWGLGNIAGDSTKVRDMVISAGAVMPVADILDRAIPGSSFVRNASWTLSNLCRGRPAPDIFKVQRAIPSLAKVLIENDVDDILIDVCWALSYLSDGGEERIPIILATNVLPRLVQLLQHDNIAISVPCLRAIGNIVTGDDDQTQYVINAGALEALNNIIYHPKKTVRKEVCWSISNITAGNHIQIQQCLDLGIIDKLINILINDDVEIKKEAVWAVSNCTAGASFQQFVALVEKGIIRGLCSVLKMKEARILAVALEGIENVLKAGKSHYTHLGEDNKFALELEMSGGLELIEPLQMHPNHQIYERVLRLLETYFQEEGDNMLDVGLSTTAQTTFNF